VDLKWKLKTFAKQTLLVTFRKCLIKLPYLVIGASVILNNGFLINRAWHRQDFEWGGRFLKNTLHGQIQRYYQKGGSSASPNPHAITAST
jgi:hypothetical protein